MNPKLFLIFFVNSYSYRAIADNGLMTVFHAICTIGVVAVNEEQFAADTLHNFDIETIVGTFAQTTMIFFAMNSIFYNFYINFKHSP